MLGFAASVKAAIEPIPRFLGFASQSTRRALYAPLGSSEAPVGENSINLDDYGSTEPTDEELTTLRRVSGKIPWPAYTVALVELCERFSWYGTTSVFVNFIQQPLPPGSTTGSVSNYQSCFAAFSEDACLQPGALGRGQRASTGLTTFNQFWAYCMPVIGGWIADEFWGRLKTIHMAICAAIIGHIILILSALPQVIQSPNGALGCFAFGLVVLGLGTGGFKSNVSVMLAEQLTDKRMEVLTLPTGERVIKDPAVTVGRVYLYFYLLINVGGLTGGISMVYAERLIGFWLAFALPTILFFLCPLILIACKKRYTIAPPAGSVMSKTLKLFRLASRGRFSINPRTTYRNFQDPDMWDAVKPSRLGPNRPDWMIGIDDAWVDQVRRGLASCRVFAWYPLYILAYNQTVGNLTSQSATLELGGVPNDIIGNLNPLTLIILIPIMDFFFYPALRRAGIQFTPIKRITVGYFVASAAMVSATILQYYIYLLGPCPPAQASDPGCTAPISVWYQAVIYCLLAISEIFANITGLEYAFTKAPENMRGVVQGIFLLQSAFAAAIGQALVPLAQDPLLIWNYGLVAVLAFAGGVGFWFTWRDLDAQEDELNSISETAFKGRKPTAVVAEDGKQP